MLRGLVATLEKHHKVHILSEAVEDAVKLSSRYISGRQLPDKAISLLDTTCARIGLSQNSTPPALEACTRRLQQLETTLGILKREMLAGTDHQSRVDDIELQIAEAEAQRTALNERWQQELNLVSKLLQLRGQLSQSLQNSNGSPESPANGTGQKAGAPVADGNASEASKHKQSASTPPSTKDAAGQSSRTQASEELKAEILALESELKALQRRTACLCKPRSSAAAATVAAWTGIPVGRMVANEVRTIMNLQNDGGTVVGQSHALTQIARASRFPAVDRPQPPHWYFPAGRKAVGKTEWLSHWQNCCNGGEQNMTVLNMSEFGEEYVSLLGFAARLYRIR